MKANSPIIVIVVILVLIFTGTWFIPILFAMEFITEFLPAAFLAIVAVTVLSFIIYGLKTIFNEIFPDTSLHGVVKSNSIESLRLLLEKEVDINAKDKDGLTALHVAASKNSQAIAKLLIEKGVDINAKDKDGLTVLRVAASKNSHTIVELLIEKGADINAKDKDGWTVLHVAAWHNSQAVVKLLIRKGADINAKTDGDRTVLGVAELAKDINWTDEHAGMVELLKSHGAQ